MNTPQIVTIRDESIRLGQLLKLAGVVEHGAEAREIITSGLVTVNGATETRRAAAIPLGSLIEIDSYQIEVHRQA